MSNPIAELKPKDISTEAWREYDFGGRVYRIPDPMELYIGHTTHRVVDSSAVTHCVPAPGQHGCVLRWKDMDPNVPVRF